MSGELWRRWLRKVAASTLLLAVLVALVDYTSDARLRAQRLPECHWNEDRPSPNDGPYVARWCYLTKDLIIIRIHDASTQQLLAERVFDDPGVPRFLWRKGEVTYTAWPHGGLILLPPTTLDRLRAKLP